MVYIARAAKIGLARDFNEENGDYAERAGEGS
jgi:hypothetical protein